MLRALGFTAVLAAVFCASAVALSTPKPPKGLKATVSGSTVTVVNHSTSTVTGLFINSTDQPKITGTSDSACKMGTSPWKDNAGKQHTDYWAKCSDALKPGKTRVVTLKTSGGTGTILVWAYLGKNQFKIGQGT